MYHFYYTKCLQESNQNQSKFEGDGWRLTGFYYKTFLIHGTQGDGMLSLPEAEAFISQGTTGLHIWEAALALSQFIYDHCKPKREKE